MAIPIQARCRRCGRDFYLYELLQQQTGNCPRCGWPLAPEYTALMLEEAARAERAQKELVTALRRLVGLPGNLDLKPYSVLRNLFDEVGWEQDLMAEPELVKAEIEQLRRQAERWAQLLDDDDETGAADLVESLRSMARRLRRAAQDRTQPAALNTAAASLETTADSLEAGTSTSDEVERSIAGAEAALSRAKDS